MSICKYLISKKKKEKSIIFVLDYVVSACFPKTFLPRARVYRASPYAWRSGLAPAGGAGALDGWWFFGLASTAILILRLIIEVV